MPCICRLCKGCAKGEEAKAQQPQPTAASGKGKGKEKKEKEKEEAAYTPTPCANCKMLSDVPVHKLLLDVGMMKQIVGEPAVAPPMCDNCDEELATKFCSNCKVNHQLLCNGCYASSHKSAKNQGHTPIPVHEHLASAPAHAAGGGAPPPPKCRIHADEARKVFCNT